MHSFVISSGLLAGGIIALIILFSIGGEVFAAHVDGTDENVDTTTTTAPPSAQLEDTQKKDTAPLADTTKKVINVLPESPAVPEQKPAFVTEKAPTSKQENAIISPETSEEKAKVPSAQSDAIKGENVAPPPKELPAVKKVPLQRAKEKAAEKYVAIDFDNVDIGVLVKFVSELTGKNFIIDDKVKGKVTIVSPKKIPITDIYKVFLSVLEVNGFAIVPSGDMVKIIPAVQAREKSVETRLKKEVTDPEDRIITQIISLNRANPDEIKRILDPIISKSSSVLSYPPAGILVITDYLSNIKRLQEIIAALDVEGAGDQISYIPLQNSSATEVVKALTTIFQQRRATATPIKIVPDSRTNSIIILASIADTESVRKLIAMMDKDLPRGESNIQVYRLQYSLAEDLAKVLNSIVNNTKAAADTQKSAATPATTPVVVSKNVQIVADKATNALVIMAERDDYKILENIIKKLDIWRPMVYIESLIMEVDTTLAFSIGVEWRGLANTGEIGGLAGSGSAGFIGSGSSSSTTTNPGGYSIFDSMTTSTGSPAFPNGFSLGIIGTGITIAGITFPNIGAVIQAYKTDDDVSILSTPQIMTIDGEEAEINVGSNVPYITQQQSTATSTLVNYNTYEYRDVGVILNITPHINEENFIRLKISAQVTKLTSAATNTTPTTLKRTAKTTVVLKDNETVVIGGLVGDSTEDTTYKVPWLGDIPILGFLFRSHSNTREKTNLYVFLTPHLVRTRQDADKLYQDKRGTMGEVVEGIIKLNEKTPEQRP